MKNRLNSNFHLCRIPPRMGGGLNTLSLDYHIHEKPVGDESKWGYLAYVSESTRKAILETGEGELKGHIEHIKKRVGALRKLKFKTPEKQLGFDL